MKKIKDLLDKNKNKILIAGSIGLFGLLIWHIGGKEKLVEIFSSRAGGAALNVKVSADGTVEVEAPRDTTLMRKADNCMTHFPWGTHKVADAAVVDRSLWICKTSFAMQYDPLVKFPMWITESVNKKNMVPFNIPKSFTLMEDPTVPRQMQLSVDIFKKLPAGYQVGLLTPIQNRYLNKDSLTADKLEAINFQSLKEAFYTTNAFPIATKAKVLVDTIDQEIRELTETKSDLMLVSGLLYFNGKTLGTVENGDEKLMIPTHIYKIVTYPKTHASISYIIPNSNTLPCGNNCTPNDFTTSLLEVERVAGVEFYTALAPFYAVQVKRDVNQIFKNTVKQ